MGAEAQRGDAKRWVGVPSNYGAVARRSLGAEAEALEAGPERRSAALRRGASGRQDCEAGGDGPRRSAGGVDRTPPWTSPAAPVGLGVEPGADLAQTAARFPREPGHAHLARGDLPGTIRPGPRRVARRADGLPSVWAGPSHATGASGWSREVLCHLGDHDQGTTRRGGRPGGAGSLGG